MTRPQKSPGQLPISYNHPLELSATHNCAAGWYAFPFRHELHTQSFKMSGRIFEMGEVGLTPDTLARPRLSTSNLHLRQPAQQFSVSLFSMPQNRIFLAPSKRHSLSQEYRISSFSAEIHLAISASTLLYNLRYPFSIGRAL